MVLFSNMVGYTSSKDDNPVQLVGNAEVTNTKRNGRTKVVMVDDEAVYWVDSELIPDESAIIAEIVTDKDPTEDKVAPESEKDPATPKSNNNIAHLVRRGETVQSIAEQYGVSVGAIINAAGGLHSVYVGQLLIFARG